MVAADETTEAATDQTSATEGQVGQTWYVILHTGVARWVRGQQISDEHLKGHDIGRLLRLGAIAVVNSAEHVTAAANLGKLWPTVTPDGEPVDNPVPVEPTPQEQADAAAQARKEQGLPVPPGWQPAAATPVAPTPDAPQGEAPVT